MIGLADGDAVPTSLRRGSLRRAPGPLCGAILGRTLAGRESRCRSTPSAKEIGVAAGEGRQQHVVDRAPASVADLFGDLKAAADDGQTAAPTLIRRFRLVRGSGAPLHEHLADRRPCPPGCAGRSLDRLG